MATWNVSFELAPRQVDSPTQGDDEIRGARAAVRERAANEHTAYTDAASTGGAPGKDWLHKQGSAVAFYQAGAPVTRINGEALVNGELWVDSDTGYLYVRYGGSWVPALRELARVSIQGTLATGVSVVPPIVFPRACTLLKVSARVLTAPVGSSLTVDLNKNGNTSWSVFSGYTVITVAAGSYADTRSSFHATYGVLAADDWLTLDIDGVGSGTAGADLSLTVEVSL